MNNVDALHEHILCKASNVILWIVGTYVQAVHNIDKAMFIGDCVANIYVSNCCSILVHVGYTCITDSIETRSCISQNSDCSVLVSFSNPAAY